MKILKVALTVTLAVSLVLGVALPGLAASDESAPQPECEPRPRLLKGEVVSINTTEEFFTIQTDNQSIEIQTNEATRYFKLTIPRRLVALYRHRMALGQPEGYQGVELLPKPLMPMKLKAIDQAPSLTRGRAVRSPALLRIEGQELAPNLPPPGWGKEIPKHLQGNLKWLRQFGEEVTLSDITLGDRVVVRVVPSNGKPLAKLVLIIEPTAYQCVIGEVIEITEGTITIDPEEGAEVELKYNEDTRFILRLRGTPFLEGQIARAIYDEDMMAKVVFAPVEMP